MTPAPRRHAFRARSGHRTGQEDSHQPFAQQRAPDHPNRHPRNRSFMAAFSRALWTSGEGGRQRADHDRRADGVAIENPTGMGGAKECGPDVTPRASQTPARLSGLQTQIASIGREDGRTTRQEEGFKIPSWHISPPGAFGSATGCERAEPSRRPSGRSGCKGRLARTPAMPGPHTTSRGPAPFRRARM